MAINAATPGILAEEALARRAALIHYSTDYVFDGSLNRPYTEDDLPNPLGVYGQSKLEGERAIQQARRRLPDPAHQLGIQPAARQLRHQGAELEPPGTDDARRHRPDQQPHLGAHAG